jgi:dihydrofolate reductase
MGEVRVHMTMTLDGYVAGPNQSVDHPFGVGTDHLNDWMFRLKSVREQFGEEGGETGASDDVFRERVANVGATIMGRNMFGGGPGPWGEEPWNGWWGDDPPYHTPVFVLTHHPREPLVMQGGTTFHFVTDGIEAALELARAAAGARDIVIGGGANVVQQYLAAGLVDEVEVHLVPLILGGGERLFDHLGGRELTFEPVRTVQGSGVTHLKYRAPTKP